MTDRRTFLKTGITALALPTIARNAFSLPLAGPAAGTSYITPYKVIFDQRYPDSLAFAAEAERLGAIIHGIQGDVTDLWYHDLYHVWKQGPAPIMGMTTPDALFCLDILARDQRMHVVLRVEHNYLSDNRIEHVINSMAPAPPAVAELEHVGPAWNIQMSGVVLRCPETRSQASCATLVTQLDRPVPDRPPPLVSWVIAPIKRA
jgi:hypothetical protein